MSQSPVTYMPGGEPFLHIGGPVGCVLVHGFTSAPQEMRWMGDYLAERELTVLGVRLVGHGTVKENLAPTTWHHWVDSALDAVTLLRPVCERVYVAGLSMGGLISLYAGVHYPVDGVISMSTPIYLKHPLLRYLQLARPFIRYYAKNEDSDSPLNQRVRAIQRERGEPEIGHAAYDHQVIPSVVNLLKLIKLVETDLPRLTVPLLLMHSREDGLALPEGMTRIYELAGSEDKEMVWIENGGHVITEDVHMEQVFETAWAFIRARSADLIAPEVQSIKATSTF